MMKHKIATLCLFSLLAGLLMLAGTGLSLAGSPPKATGGVAVTTDDGVQRWVEFTAHEAYNNRPAKGMINYHDSAGDWYKVDLHCVVVEDDHAYFWGPVVGTNRSDWEGMWVLAAAHDGGTPGSKGDEIWGTFLNPDPDCLAGYYPSGGMLAVEKGNLVVH